ncbi:MAG: DUF1501 domain-containing protein [Bryobacteraceae bacterium]|nr:DUF1501 domain-containing protein [Bryobacteraceae bacterium]
MITRRKAVQWMGAGFGLVGLGDSLHAASTGKPHFAPKAKHVIFLYLNGGLSHVDSFDPKPELDKRDGQPMPGPKVKTDRASGGLMKSPFPFRKYGASGIEVSGIFPKIGERIDDFLVVRSMYSDSINHLPSMLMMNTGHALRGGSRPSFGSWVTYGLGTENQNLPGYVVMCPGQPVGGARLWSSAFLPTAYEGAQIRNDADTADKLIQDIANKSYTPEQQERQLGLLAKMDASFLQRVGYDPRLEANIAAMETAFKMQTEAPGIFDLTKEPETVRARYGAGEFGRGCLMALRLVEAGVRVVQVYYGDGQPWDSHDDIIMQKHHARRSDGPIAALVEDLKARGLFEQTLVIVGSEFGRTPMIQNSGTEKVGRGRDHNPPGYSILLAGGGIRGGQTYGATDDFGYKAVDKRVSPHDLHATALHLLGLDHTKLTYRYSGRDYRLTDVHGNVIREWLA